MSRRCLGGVWEVSRRCLGGLASWRCVSGVPPHLQREVTQRRETERQSGARRGGDVGAQQLQHGARQPRHLQQQLCPEAVVWREPLVERGEQDVGELVVPLERMLAELGVGPRQQQLVPLVRQRERVLEERA